MRARLCSEESRHAPVADPAARPARGLSGASAAAPLPACGGHHVQHWQAVPKPLRDTQLHEVVAQRYRCVRCGRTFRVYPLGVSHDQTSARLKGVAVMFYVLGMSYGAVATALEALGWPLSKVAVYYAVQEAGAAVAGLRREAVRRGGGRVVGLGVDLTSVRCGGQWLTVGISVDAVQGTVLSLDLLPNGEAATLTAWVQDLAAALGAEVLVSDDADGFKTAADESGLLSRSARAMCSATPRRGWRPSPPRWRPMPMARWPASGSRRSRPSPTARSCCA